MGAWKSGEEGIKAIEETDWGRKKKPDLKGYLRKKVGEYQKRRKEEKAIEKASYEKAKVRYLKQRGRQKAKRDIMGGSRTSGIIGTLGEIGYRASKAGYSPFGKTVFDPYLSGKPRKKRKRKKTASKRKPRRVVTYY